MTQRLFSTQFKGLVVAAAANKDALEGDLHTPHFAKNFELSSESGATKVRFSDSEEVAICSKALAESFCVEANLNFDNIAGCEEMQEADSQVVYFYAGDLIPVKNGKCFARAITALTLPLETAGQSSSEEDQTYGFATFPGGVPPVGTVLNLVKVDDLNMRAEIGSHSGLIPAAANSNFSSMQSATNVKIIDPVDEIAIPEGLRDISCHFVTVSKNVVDEFVTKKARELTLCNYKTYTENIQIIEYFKDCGASNQQINLWVYCLSKFPNIWDTLSEIPSEWYESSNPKYWDEYFVSHSTYEADGSGYLKGVLLAGPTGIGKNRFVDTVGYLLNGVTGNETCYSSMSDMELFGNIGLNNGNTVFHKSPFTSLCERKGVFSLDEVNALRPDVQLSLNSSLDHNRKLVIRGQENQEQVLKLNSGFQVFMTANLGYLGTQPVAPSTKTRMVIIHMEREGTLATAYRNRGYHKDSLQVAQTLVDYLYNMVEQGSITEEVLSSRHFEVALDADKKARALKDAGIDVPTPTIQERLTTSIISLVEEKEERKILQDAIAPILGTI